jgi:uncharacterized protein YdaU (DUF1376 family)
MGKDPSVSFYPSDFLAGTCYMSFEEKGRYITLLCYQHGQGPIPAAAFAGIADTDMVRSKFVSDDNGESWYNIRMRDETAKRKAYVESRKANGALRFTHVQEHKQEHMPEHVENGNGNEKDNEKGSSKKPERPTVEQVVAYCAERGNDVDAQKWFDHYSSNGWKVGRNPMKDWKASVRTWERSSFTNQKGGANGKNINNDTSPNGLRGENGANRADERRRPAEFAESIAIPTLQL